MARQAVSAWRHLRRFRNQLLAVQRGRRQSGTVPVRRARLGKTHHAAGGGRFRLARLSAGNRVRPAVRLPGTRALRSLPRHPVQPEQAADRPLLEGHRRPLRLEPVGVRLQLRRSRQPQRRRLRGQHAQVGRDQPVLRLGHRPSAAARVRRHHHLRGARQGTDRNPPRHPGADPRHVRRDRPSGHHRSPQVARDQRPRTDAGAPLRQRRHPARQGTVELLGVQHDRVLRARRQVRVELHPRRTGAGVQGDGALPARGRDRGHPRRRVQPHRGGQPHGPDAVDARYRQPGLLPASTTTSGTTRTTPAPETASTCATRTPCS